MFEQAANGGVDFAEVAQQQAASERMLAAALEGAMRAPHTVTRIASFAVGVQRSDTEVTLMFATPDGRRYDLEQLSPATVRAIINGLTEGDE